MLDSSRAQAERPRPVRPTSTEVRRVNVPFSHPSGSRPQKDGRKVRWCCEGTFTSGVLRSGARSLGCRTRSRLPPAAPPSPPPRSVRFRAEIGPVPRRDRFAETGGRLPARSQPSRWLTPRWDDHFARRRGSSFDAPGSISIRPARRTAIAASCSQVSRPGAGSCCSSAPDAPSRGGTLIANRPAGRGRSSRPERSDAPRPPRRAAGDHTMAI